MLKEVNLNKSIILRAIFLLFVTSFFILATATTSIGQYWNLKKIDSGQGLSNSAVTSIFLDSKDYMWFGTWDGLNKYDGKNIVIYMPDRNTESSISNNIIREVIEDRNNNLWIVTDKNINLYDRTTESFKVYLNPDNFSLGRERIIRSSMANDSTLWYSIYGVGIVNYSEQEDSLTQIKSTQNIEPSLKRIVGIKAFSNQRLALLNDDGDLITLIKEEVWTAVRIDSLSASNNVIPDQHWFIDFQDTPVLFMTLEGGGLLYVDINTGASQKIEAGNEEFIITELASSKSDNFLWLGTDNGTIFKLFSDNGLSVQNVDDLFPELVGEKVKILKIYEVEPNLLWIGTDGNGILEYNTEGSPFSSIKKGELTQGKLSHNIIRAIYEEPSGRIIVGTRGSGLNVVDKELSNTSLITTENGLSNNAVLAIERDNHLNYWIGLDGEGIDFIEHESGKILHFPNDFTNEVNLSFKSVYAICIDSYNNIWLGTSGHGIIKLAIKKNGVGKYALIDYQQFLKKSNIENALNSNIVYSIIEDRPNFLWIGSRGGGVQLLNTLTSEFSNLPSQIDSDVIALYKSTLYKELWVGTSNGLYNVSLIDKNYNYEFFNSGSGLLSNTIHAVQEDEMGNIWISTNRGLSNWNRKLNHFSNYNKNDGLAGNEYSDGASFSGSKSKRLYFGGINGLTIIEPDKIKYSDDYPRLALQELKLFNKLIIPGNKSGLLQKHIDDTDTLIFDSEENFFSISYAALNYTNNEKSNYAYYLEGFDKEWTYIGSQRSAFFTNVPPGDYSLKLKCSNADGMWSDEYRSLLIIVKPPIWRTLIAYVIYSVSILGLIFLIYYILRRRTRMQKEIYFAQLEKRNIEEINNYKLRFFTNVSHEFRTPLSLILFPANNLFENKDKYPELRSSFESIYYNSNRLLKLIGELIEFRKAESDQVSLAVSPSDISLFLEKITDAFSSYAEDHKVSISFENELPDRTPVWFDHDKLKTIMLNLISNAIKYNTENGVVTVSVTIDHDEALITVEDTGIGMPENLLEKIFQRFYNLASENHTQPDPNKSSGIGLALTKSLVESHLGSIQVSSKEGEGSIFYIKIPVNKESYTDYLVEGLIQHDPLIIEQKIDSEFVNFKRAKTANSSLEVESSNRYCLLVVDDNEQFRTIIKEMFLKNYDIIEAGNGAEAIDIITENSIDLIISDVLMPEIDGYELCKKIKEDINTSHIPVILLTAMGEIEDRIKGIDIGADSFIPKPFHPKHLITRVEKLLESKENIRELLKNAPWKLAENVNGLVKKDQIWLNKVAKYIIDNMSDPDLDSNLMVEEFGISKTQLYRKIKALTDHTPHGFIRKYRLKKAAELLKNSDLTISEISYETGFNNRSYFYRIFKEEFNSSPSDFRSKAS